ncbi:MAG: GatB/YqeY domain-containing protein [Helicobacter sp.]|nr:GatB/YqeY domain-containing protein [Helicobacter sp.]
MASQIKNRLQEETKEAMKSGDKQKRDALRVLSSLLKQVEVDERKELSDEEVIVILKKAYKQREEAAKQYKEANRQDLLDKEEFEMQLILSYLPKQLDDEELKIALKEIIYSLKAESLKDLGKVMGVATKQLGALANGSRISAMAKDLLSLS